LLTAYQEDLLSLDELRRRMPELRQRETRLMAERESLSDQLAVSGKPTAFFPAPHRLGTMASSTLDEERCRWIEWPSAP